MKKAFLIFLTFLFAGPANSTVCTEYLSTAYQQPVTLTSKKEYIDKYEEMIGSNFVSSIVYGKGYLKFPEKRRLKIYYICQLESYNKPIWGYVIPH